MVNYPQPVRRGGFVPLFLVVVAVIVGLLAMHIFVSRMGNHNEPSMSSIPISAVTPETGTQTPTAAGHAAAMPASFPDPMMSSIICILALLLTGLLLAAARPAILRAPFLFTGIARQLVFVPGTLAGPAPPNLIVLSISRV